MQIELKKKLYDNIKGYCETNNLNMEKYVNDLLTKAFMVDKYGERPEVFEKHALNADEFKPVAEELIAITTNEEPDLKEIVKTALANKTDNPEEITLETITEAVKQSQVAETKEENTTEKPKRRKLK